MLTKIYNDFKTERANWCFLPRSQFSNSVYSDFSNKHYGINVIEQFYLLRYLPMYTYEYYKMYDQFLEHYSKKDLRVLSVGVGAGLDHIGLTAALEKRQVVVDYLGIDLVDWKYRDEKIDFIQIDLKDIAKNNKVMDFIKKGVDVIIFPKSIIEIESKSLVDFSNLLIENKVNDVWFLNSFIKGSNKISGLNEFTHFIYKHFQYDNYTLLDKIESVAENMKINYSSMGIKYQSTWFGDIKHHCHGKCNEEQRRKCNIVGQYPMMYTKHIAYAIYNLKKVV